eukprot:CAMPEP_0181486686 /NCGR_PEP_ID=MMETSP1110-20121109/47341_1 /TAXON_ID=174948 /ORGANISM="Symbiodinium sp., Strain CCMP421" /LENGTH=67 /DNA_ID=CAMNT_0023612989 /DNA_START=72 /DNA_END=275 /DNA_ORIENTATION=-
MIAALNVEPVKISLLKSVAAKRVKQEQEQAAPAPAVRAAAARRDLNREQVGTSPRRRAQPTHGMCQD